MNGVINVYKEAGYTSHDVVARLRGILGQRRIGHTGTLDPDAVGVLPVCLGSATRLCDMLTDTTKEYEALLLLGLETDTQDLSGKVLNSREVRVTEEQVREAVLSFIGLYDQIPPMYSALKVNGKKLYELAREGKTVERRARRVRIESIEILEMDLPRIRLLVNCSKGTYIRTLCHDIGQKLGTGGAMETLCRTRAGVFRIEEAVKLDVLEEARRNGEIEKYVIAVDRLLEEYEAVTVKKSYEKLVQNGNPLVPEHLTQEGNFGEDCQVRVYNESGRFYGIYRYIREEKRLKPVKMFLEQE